MYKLSSKFAGQKFTVTVVGCGGTGGFVAESLSRLLPEHADLVLVDHDRVEEINLLRQNFYHEDLGGFKSEILAHRLSRKFNRPIGYSTLPVAMVQFAFPGLVIGCVDNGPARRNIARAFEGKIQSSVSWWVDSGNGDNYGQVIVGNSNVASYWSPTEDIYYQLPLPTIQKPELMNQAPKTRGCAEVAEEQGPTINLTMAAVVVEVVRRLIAGTCHWIQLYVDMEAGILVPVLATPETVKAISRRKGGEP